MSNIPTFSFIMPLFNAEKWMKTAISSIINQSSSDWEAILINDGSSDHTLSILEEYQSKFPNKFLIKTISNSGPAKARRIGAELSSGKYVLFLDSDDYVSVDYIQQIGHVLKSYPEVDMIIPELMSEKRNGSWESFNKIFKLKQGQILKGNEAFRRTFPWSIHGFAGYKRSLFLEASEGNLDFNRYNADEFVTRVYLLKCKQIVISAGQYFHKSNSFSLTKKISINKLGFLATEKRLIELTIQEDKEYLNQVISDSNRKLFTSFFSFLLQRELFTKVDFIKIIEEHKLFYNFLKSHKIKLIDITKSLRMNLIYRLFYNCFNSVYLISKIYKLKKNENIINRRS